MATSPHKPILAIICMHTYNQYTRKLQPCQVLDWGCLLLQPIASSCGCDLPAHYLTRTYCTARGSRKVQDFSRNATAQDSCSPLHCCCKGCGFCSILFAATMNTGSRIMCTLRGISENFPCSPCAVPACIYVRTRYCFLYCINIMEPFQCQYEYMYSHSKGSNENCVLILATIALLHFFAKLVWKKIKKFSCYLPFCINKLCQSSRK